MKSGMTYNFEPGALQVAEDWALKNGIGHSGELYPGADAEKAYLLQVTSAKSPAYAAEIGSRAAE